MFVRFRAAPRRLDLSLLETKRQGAKVRHEHVAGLGSCPHQPSPADRIHFWRRLHERLAKLSNRIGAEDHAKILGAVHARVPMPTPDEQRALQLENAKQDAQLWAGARDLNEANVETYREMTAPIEKAIANGAETAERAKVAAERVAKIERGEDVHGGLGKPMTREDIEAALLKGGFTRKTLRRAAWLASLSEDEFAAAQKEARGDAKVWEAHDALINRVMRRAVRKMRAG